MPKLELDKIAVTQLTRLLPQERRKGRHWSRALKVSTCMYDLCVCVQLPRADRVLRFSIENASKRLDYPAVVYCGAVPDFCRCCHPTGRWLPALWTEKHGLIKELLTGAIIEFVARPTARTATNAVRV